MMNENDFFDYFFDTTSLNDARQLEISQKIQSFKTKESSPTPRRDFLGLKSLKFNLSLPKYDLFWKIIERRRSRRDFVKKSISFHKLELLLAGAIGRNGESEGNFTRRTPTAGGLVGLQCYLLSFNIESLEKGVYYIDEDAGELFMLSDKLPAFTTLEKMLYLDTLQNAAGVIILCGDLSSSLQKYGIRAMRYALLDCGHAMQNFYLSAEKLKLKFVSLGGINEKKTARLLEIKNRYEIPLYAGVFGV